MTSEQEPIIAHDFKTAKELFESQTSSRKRQGKSSKFGLNTVKNRRHLSV